MEPDLTAENETIMAHISHTSTWWTGSVARGMIRALLLAGCAARQTPDAPDASEWPAYGGDAGGSRYSAADQIRPANVDSLAVAWTFSTGDVSHDPGKQVQGQCGSCHTGDVKFETTPILAGGRLFVSTPLNRIIALDPASGTELWRFDPKVRLDMERNEGFVSRGVAYWRQGSDTTLPCSQRVFLGTIEARLHAVDAATGQPCEDFGDQGTVRLDLGVGNVQDGQYGVTSPPTVVGDVVVVGSSIGDNRRVDLERGVVRAYDARSGQLRWAWDPIPRDTSDPLHATWSAEAAAVTGGANAWAPLSADGSRDLVFVPTGSAAPDFYGGQRPGDNRYANSVVALRASTGKVVWHFQVVHHDVWDYDVPAQPTLTTVRRNGVDVPAVVVVTKQGFLFVLHRETGEPLFPVEERPVPPGSVPGEVLSPTQPFPVLPAPLHPFGFSSTDVFGATEADRTACRALREALEWDGMYTPPGFKGTLMYPGYGGGMNWGGVAIDSRRRWAIVNVMRLPFWVRLQRRSDPKRGNQLGTPYQMTRAMLAGPSGAPCSPPPWSTLVAVDLNTGEKRWEVPFGLIPALVKAGTPDVDRLGSPSLGGPLVTAGGLVFIAAAMDDALRAFDIETGREIWKGALPAGGQATPMTYVAGGRQFVVIAAGGHGSLGTTRGDHVVAFALPAFRAPSTSTGSRE